jgi:hypothetical protein
MTSWHLHNDLMTSSQWPHDIFTMISWPLQNGRMRHQPSWSEARFTLPATRVWTDIHRADTKHMCCNLHLYWLRVVKMLISFRQSMHHVRTPQANIAPLHYGRTVQENSFIHAFTFRWKHIDEDHLKVWMKTYIKTFENNIENMEVEIFELVAELVTLQRIHTITYNNTC